MSNTITTNTAVEAAMEDFMNAIDDIMRTADSGGYQTDDLVDLGVLLASELSDVFLLSIGKPEEEIAKMLKEKQAELLEKYPLDEEEDEDDY